MSHSKYREIPETEVPADLRFDVPRHNQGQMVEVAYADYPTDRYEACSGATYKRVTDRSDGSVTYYKRAK
jgi:hypothetical protein